MTTDRDGITLSARAKRPTVEAVSQPEDTQVTYEAASSSPPGSGGKAGVRSWLDLSEDLAAVNVPTAETGLF